LRIRLAFVALALTAALPLSVAVASGHHAGAPRSESAAQSLRPDAPLRLVADPASPVVDTAVTIRVEGSAPPRATTVRFHTPGIHVVKAHVGTAGATRTLTLTVTVRPSPHPAAVTSPSPRRRAPAPRAKPRTVSQAPRARIAGDPGVTIVDFQFNPGSITIHTGDTITWANTGSQPHTATANDHSFDTGTLNKGQSASHTFTQPGTFSYICTIHPFMHGTVTVVGSGGGGSGGGGSGSGSSGGTSSGSSSGSAATDGSGGSSASGSGQLPFTGFNLVAAGLTGLLLIASGAGLRWWAWRSGRPAHPET